MKKSEKTILYIIITISIITIVILIGIILNLLEKNKIIDSKKTNVEQLTKTTSNNTYVDINTHLSEVNDATKVDESVAATADNITEGKQAWVNGELITGNGADNNLHRKNGYDEGYAKGYSDATNSSGKIQYVYHSHQDSCYCGSGLYCTETEWDSMLQATRYHFNCHEGHYYGSTCDVSSVPSKCRVVCCGKTTQTIESATIVYD